MSFDKMNLPKVLLADLYKEVLVVIDNEVNTVKKTHNQPGIKEKEELILVNDNLAKTADTTPQNGLSYLGNNQKNICIIVRDEQAIHLQDELLDILSAILNACKLNLADVAIINTYNQQVKDAGLRNALQPKSVLLFGVETSQIGLPFSIPDHKIQQFNNCSYLQCASLEKMKGNSTEAKVEKSKLWVCLKTLFSV